MTVPDAAERIVAAGLRIATDAGLGGAPMVAVGWATVELDRAAADLGGSGAGWVDVGRDPHLGAAVRLGPALVPGGPRLALLEPDTEGRLAASLARFGEGAVAAYVRLEADPAGAGGAVRWSAAASGPLGRSRLLLGPVAGPHLVGLLPDR